MKLPVRSTDSGSEFSVQMTPLIDVIFLLMIFFVMTMKFQELEGVIKSRLPEKGDQSFSEYQKDWETVRIHLATENGRFTIYLQERIVYSQEALLSYLNRLPPQIMIVIEPEAKVLYKHVIGVYNTCLKSKKSNIVFSARPYESITVIK
jgi:biopolymer transport protein ExbD